VKFPTQLDPASEDQQTFGAALRYLVDVKGYVYTDFVPEGSTDPDPAETNAHLLAHLSWQDLFEIAAPFLSVCPAAPTEEQKAEILASSYPDEDLLAFNTQQGSEVFLLVDIYRRSKNSAVVANLSQDDITVLKSTEDITFTEVHGETDELTEADIDEWGGVEVLDQAAVDRVDVKKGNLPKAKRLQLIARKSIKVLVEDENLDISELEQANRTEKVKASYLWVKNRFSNSLQFLIYCARVSDQESLDEVTGITYGSDWANIKTLAGSEQNVVTTKSDFFSHRKDQNFTVENVAERQEITMTYGQDEGTFVLTCAVSYEDVKKDNWRLFFNHGEAVKLGSTVYIGKFESEPGVTQFWISDPDFNVTTVKPYNSLTCLSIKNTDKSASVTKFVRLASATIGDLDPIFVVNGSPYTLKTSVFDGHPDPGIVADQGYEISDDGNFQITNPPTVDTVINLTYTIDGVENSREIHFLFVDSPLVIEDAENYDLLPTELEECIQTITYGETILFNLDSGDVPTDPVTFSTMPTSLTNVEYTFFVDESTTQSFTLQVNIDVNSVPGPSFICTGTGTFTVINGSLTCGV